MHSLLIDTHNEKIVLVLYKNSTVIDIIEKKSNQSHSIYVMNLIKEILDKNNIHKNDIEELYVVNGPGSFTGVRIGITIAKTWAVVKNIKIKTIDSLELIASSLNEKNITTGISDKKGYYIGDFTKEKYFYISKEEFNDLNQKVYLEEDIKVNYSNVYNYLQKKSYENPHLLKPIYIKKIGVGND